MMPRGTIIGRVIVALLTVFALLPILWLAYSAFLPPNAALQGRIIGDGYTLENFIKLPFDTLLRPSLIFLGVIGSLYALQSYTAVFLLTRGGPFGSTRVLGYFLYETAFEKFEFGYGAALSVLVLAVAFTFAALQARALRSD